MGKKEVRVEDLSEDQRYALYSLAHPFRRKGIQKGLKTVSTEKEIFRPRGDYSPQGTKDNALYFESLSYRRQAELKDLEEKGLIKSKGLFGHYGEIYDNPTKAAGKEVITRYTLTLKGHKIFRQIEKNRNKQRTQDSETSLASRVTASIFLVAGFIFMIIPDFTATGNIIGSNSASNLSFFLSLGLMIIGGVLLFQSFKKKG